MDIFVIFLSYTLFFLFLYKLLKTNNLLVMLPLYYMFTVSYVLTGVFVYDYAKQVPFDLYSKITEDGLIKSAWFYIVAASFFYFGSSFFSKNSFGVNSFRLNIPYQKSIFVLFCFVLFVFIFSYGSEPLFYREGYISKYHDRNKFGLIVFYVFAPISFVTIPFLNNRFVRYLLYFLAFLMLFSSSSRFLVMLPFLYVVGTYLKYGSFRFFTSLLQVSIIVFGLVFVLQIRYYPYQGLIPNIESLFSKGVDLEYFFTGLNYAFSFSLMGTAYVVENIPFDLKGFLVGINPAPSRYVDIEYMLLVQEMLPTAPISAISLLSQSGLFLISLFFFLTGFVFSFIFNEMKGKTIFYYFVSGAFVIFMLFSIQYNIRGLTRFLYFSIVIYLLYKIFFRYKFVFRGEG